MNINLSSEINRAIKTLGYNKFTKVQEKVIPEALLNKDLIVKAQTGSGKTAAFVIPVCEKIKWEENNPQCLILSPTRELAIQTAEEVKNIGRYKRIKGVSIYGKAPFKDQERELKGKTHIVIGTPGRILDHIDRKTLITSSIRYLIIDEADEMFNMGFIRQIEAVFRRIPKKRATMLFSATINDEIRELCDTYMNRPIDIEIESKNITADNIEHIVYEVSGSEKLNYLNNLLLKEIPKQCVVFCRTKDNVELAFSFLQNKGYSVTKIHGGMMQKDRIKAMEEYKSGNYRILVATDIAARGIDVDDISHVINIDIPVEKESYVHRIGRTARGEDKIGKAITFKTPYEDRILEEIREYTLLPLEVHSIEELDDVDLNKASILKTNLKKKQSKKNNINKGVTKLYFNGGKKKKIRTIDFVGTISNITGVCNEDIGIIDIQDTVSYVEILNNKGKIVLEAMKNKTIKGKKLRVEVARK